MFNEGGEGFRLMLDAVVGSTNCRKTLKLCKKKERKKEKKKEKQKCSVAFVCGVFFSKKILFFFQDFLFSNVGGRQETQH